MLYDIGLVKMKHLYLFVLILLTLQLRAFEKMDYIYVEDLLNEFKTTGKQICYNYSFEDVLYLNVQYEVELKKIDSSFSPREERDHYVLLEGESIEVMLQGHFQQIADVFKSGDPGFINFLGQCFSNYKFPDAIQEPILVDSNSALVIVGGDLGLTAFVVKLENETGLSVFLVYSIMD